MTSATTAACAAVDPRLRIERQLTPAALRCQLADDVRRGLLAPRKVLPPKYFYDARGAQLFEAICNLPEYYLTRSEHALLAGVAGEVVAAVAPAHLVELGSGASRKTRRLLDALVRGHADPWYVPIDVSEAMLRESAAALRLAYPTLGVHGVVTDYEHALPPLPPAPRRLVAFLGSSIGNFVPPDDVRFLRTVAARLAPGDRLLLGVDLLKAVDILEAAYDDTAGVTAEFNRNVLRVINRELGANFTPERFEHVALFNAAAAQIEMHLRAREAQRVRIAALDAEVCFAAGETIHTESSRKFTRASVSAMLAAGGFRLERWLASGDAAFALALAAPVVDA